MRSVQLPELEDIAGAGEARLAELFAELEQVIRQAEVLQAEVIGEVDRTGLYGLDGHTTAASWARALGNWSTARSKRFSQAAQLLHASAEVRDAAHQARLGADQLRRLSMIWANRRVREHFPGSAELLVEHAQRLRYPDFAVLCDRWMSLADADGARRRHDFAHESRFARIDFVGEQALLHAEGGMLAGAYLREIHEQFCATEFHADWEAGVAEHGQAMCAEMLERNAGQRSFDALVKIFQAAEGSGVLGEIRPVVNVVVDSDTFEREIRRVAGATVDPIDPATVAGRRCETPDGVQVDPADMLAAALLGHVRRVVLDSAGVVIDLGRKRRLFTGAAREAAMLFGSRTCVHPGCYRPTRHSQVDHTTPWGGGGPTDQVNGGIECGFHNRLKNNGYTTRRDQDGQWHTYRPDGVEIAPLTQLPRRAPPDEPAAPAA
jgi:hypothetical protein